MTTKNLILGSAIRVASMSLIVATPVVATRLLAPSGVAQVMIAISIGTMIGVVGPLGLPWALAYRVAQVRVGTEQVQRLSADLRAALIYLGALLLVLCAVVMPPWALPAEWVVPNTTSSFLLAVVVIGVARATSKVMSEVSKSYGKVNTAAIGSDLIGPTLGLLLMGLLTLTPLDLSSAEVVWCLAAGWLAAASYSFIMSPVQPNLSETPTTTTARREGLVALAVISVLNVGIQQLHIVISGFALGLDDAAIFATAARLATLTGAPLMIIAGLASPDIGIALHSEDETELGRVQRRLQRLTGIFFTGSALLFGVYVLAGGVIMRVLFGDGYEAGHLILIVLAVGPLGSLLAGVAGLTLMLGGERRLLLRDTLIGSLVAVVAMVLGAQWGGIGLATGYSTGQLVINILLLRTCRSATGITPMANPVSLARGTLQVLGRNNPFRRS